MQSLTLSQEEESQSSMVQQDNLQWPCPSCRPVSRNGRSLSRLMPSNMFRSSLSLSLLLLTATHLPGLLQAAPLAGTGEVECTGEGCQPPSSPDLQPDTGTPTAPRLPFAIMNKFLDEELEAADILFTKEDMKDMLQSQERSAHVSDHARRKRKVQNFNERPTRKWTLPIHFKFHAGKDLEGENIRGHSDTEKDIIRGAFRHWEEHTCVVFQEMDAGTTVPSQYLLITNQHHFCASYVGRVHSETPQQLNMAFNCLLKFGTPVHEIGHALGLWHEHQRPDRDQFLDIQQPNIGYWAAGNFRTPPSYLINNYNLPYDYNSVMHYGPTVGTYNGFNTIFTKDARFQQNIGQRVQLSFLDAKAINMAYCSDHCAKRLSRRCENGGYQDPLRCDNCRCPAGLTGRYCETRATTAADCGGTYHLLPGENRVLTTPGYEQGRAYQPRDQCNWIVKAPQGRRVRLEFEDEFSLFCHRESCFHWVEVQFQRDLSLPGPRFCCSRRPSTIMLSDGEQMLVTFRSNWTGAAESERMGFKARVSVVSADGKNFKPMAPAPAPREQPPTTKRTTTTTTSTTATTTTTTTTIPPPHSTAESGSQVITWSSWSGCAGHDCPCGGCSKQSRVRMCGTHKCTGSLAAEEYSQCSRICTSTDKKQFFLGKLYERPCPVCCPGFKIQGKDCVIP